MLRKGYIVDVKTHMYIYFNWITHSDCVRSGAPADLQGLHFNRGGGGESFIGPPF